MMSKFENEATDHCVLNAKSKIRLKINLKKTKKKKPNCSYRLQGSVISRGMIWSQS